MAWLVFGYLMVGVGVALFRLVDIYLNERELLEYPVLVSLMGMMSLVLVWPVAIIYPFWKGMRE